MNYGYSNAFLNHNIIKHTLMIFIFFGKTLNYNILSKKVPGYPS